MADEKQDTKNGTGAAVPDYTKATHLLEIDRLRLQVMTEKERRIQAELDNTRLSMANLEKEWNTFLATKGGFGKQLIEKYGLMPGFNVSQETGQIMRPAPVRIAAHEKKEEPKVEEPANPGTPEPDPVTEAAPSGTVQASA